MMKIGIVGLPGSGKTTIFNAITGSSADVSLASGGKKEPNIAVVKVPDERLEHLSSMYNPKKTTHAQVQYLDIGGEVSSREEKGSSIEETLRFLRPTDALLMVVRNFEYAGISPTPQKDLDDLESEMILTDLISVEKRLERLSMDIRKGKKGNPQELELLEKAKEVLNSGKALRGYPNIALSPLLKGYTFLSAKPCIVVLNSGEEDAGAGSKSPLLVLPEGVSMIEIRGQIEMEIAQLPPDEAEVFMEDFSIQEPATKRIIQESYRILGLISFFTVGEDEVRAWTIPYNTPAQKAAGTIHSDIEKGFIRAEVVSYDDLISLGSYQKAQKEGRVRLEGKEYPVKDGDIINFRFNV